MSNLWIFISRPKNRVILGWLGGGLVVLAGGIWTIVTYVWPHDKPTAPGVVQQGIYFGGGVDRSSITNNASGSPTVTTAPAADAAEAKAPTAAPAGQEHKK